MLNQTKTEEDIWAERGEYWLKRLNPVPQYKARKRRFIHKPLVLSGHGIRIRIDRGTLLITCGFTHYPQKREEYRFFMGDMVHAGRLYHGQAANWPHSSNYKGNFI